MCFVWSVEFKSKELGKKKSKKEFILNLEYIKLWKIFFFFFEGIKLWKNLS